MNTHESIGCWSNFQLFLQEAYNQVANNAAADHPNRRRAIRKLWINSRVSEDREEWMEEVIAHCERCCEGGVDRRTPRWTRFRGIEGRR